LTDPRVTVVAPQAPRRRRRPAVRSGTPLGQAESEASARLTIRRTPSARPWPGRGLPGVAQVRVAHGAPGRRNDPVSPGRTRPCIPMGPRKRSGGPSSRWVGSLSGPWRRTLRRQDPSCRWPRLLQPERLEQRVELGKQPGHLRLLLRRVGRRDRGVVRGYGRVLHQLAQAVRAERVLLGRLQIGRPHGLHVLDHLGTYPLGAVLLGLGLPGPLLAVDRLLLRVRLHAGLNLGLGGRLGLLELLTLLRRRLLRLRL